MIKIVEKILERNKRVEADKAWETSNARRLIISLMTYAIVVIFLFLAGITKEDIWIINALFGLYIFIINKNNLMLAVLHRRHFHKNQRQHRKNQRLDKPNKNFQKQKR